VVERYIGWCVASPDNAPSEWVAVHKELAMLPGAKQAFLAVLRAANGVFGTKRRELEPILFALPQLSAETLLICGGKDRFIPTRYSRRAAARMPEARLVVFPDCGHVPHVECPERFYPLVSSFLKGGLGRLERSDAS
jgi:4,5:9,10-diseco-3-hydroxy-5,9,17-trioxoandrosta-1(10),2-diene-4-oate hydrolase